MDVAVIGLQAHSDPIKTATGELERFSKASHKAETANDNRAASDKRAAAAAHANAKANKALAVSAGTVAFRQRQLAVQSLDVAQSLAMGISPMQTAIQQGGQVAGLYAGQGGVSAAFKEATNSVMGFVRAHPALIAATAAIGTAFVGMRHEINKTSDVSVSLGQTFKATMNVAASAIKDVLEPALTGISKVASMVWDELVRVVKSTINGIIKLSLAGFETIKSGLFTLADSFLIAGENAANFFMQGIGKMVSRAQSALQSILDVINKVSGTELSVGAPLGGSKFDFANDARKRIANRSSELKKQLGVIGDTDYAGQAFSAIREEAVRLAIAAEEAGKKTGKSFKKAAKTAGDAWKGLRTRTKSALDETVKFSRDLTGGFITDLRSSLEQGEGAWDSFKNAALNALDKITDRLLNEVLDAMFQVNDAGKVGPSGGSSGGVGSIFSSLLGGLFSFDGGGYTGRGSRSGGVDGRGGFPAILHPNETVIDHGRAMPMQAANSNQPLNIHLTGSFNVKSEDEKFTAEVANIAATVVNQASPGIVGQAVSASSASAGKGGFDRSMGKRFGVAKKAPAR